MTQQIVHLYVFDTLADWEIGYAIAGINNPVLQTQPGRYKVQTVGLSADPITTIGGIKILPDLRLDQLGTSAMLVLPGGEAWDAGKNIEVLEITRDFLDKNIPIAAICGATAGLARAGILDDKHHTSNAPEYLQAAHYRGVALYQNQPAVTDGNVITANSTAPIDFAYHIFKKLDLYTPEILDAWYGLFKTGDPAYFATLERLEAQVLQENMNSN